MLLFGPVGRVCLCASGSYARLMRDVDMTCQRTAIDITLDSTAPETEIGAMSNKVIVEDLLQRLPENTSLRDIAREIEFVAAVREGLAELDRGEGIPIEDIERELPSWIIG